MPSAPIYETVTVEYRGGRFSLAFFCRPGVAGHVLFLHGLGCSKADFEGALYVPALQTHTLLALDFPGMGASPYAGGQSLTLPDLASLAQSFLLAINVRNAHLVGHSLGGAVATLMAAKNPSGFSSLVNVEGNLLPEDCFYSRGICSEADSQDGKLRGREAILRTFLQRLEARATNREYARRWQKNVSSIDAIFDYSRSLVELSDAAVFFRAFRSFPGPRLFVHGEENAGLSYLPLLIALGVTTCSVPASRHFPHYTNPEYFYRSLARWLQRLNARQR